MEHRRFGLFLSAKRENITTATVSCVSTAGCCAPPVVICRRARAGEELNWGRARSFFFKFSSDSSDVGKELNFKT